MRFVHQLSEMLHIACLQRGNRLNRPLILIHRMLRTASADLVLNQALVCLIFLDGKIAKGLHIQLLLKICQCSAALLSPKIVFRIHKTVLLVRVGYHQLHACQIQRRVLKLHAVGIQENRIAFLAHCGRKLVHDAALHTVVFVLRILPDKSKILICKHIFHPEKAAEHLSGQNLK